jgi:hypothetical protein
LIPGYGGPAFIDAVVDRRLLSGRHLVLGHWAAHPGDRDPVRATAGLSADGYTGRVCMVVDEDHGCLLGVTFVARAWRS